MYPLSRFLLDVIDWFYLLWHLRSDKTCSYGKVSISRRWSRMVFICECCGWTRIPSIPFKSRYFIHALYAMISLVLSLSQFLSVSFSLYTYIIANQINIVILICLRLKAYIEFGFDDDESCLSKSNIISYIQLTHLSLVTKWPPFRRRRFQMPFYEWKVLYVYSNFTEVLFYGSN